LILENLQDDRKSLLALAEQLEELEKRLSIDGPQDDDELHYWIKTNLGFEIPRNSVCDNHRAPFDFIADLFFNRVGSALLMANRGGNKTHGVAILHLLNMLYKPGIECATVGAIEAQADRAYNHFRMLVRTFNENTGQDILETSMQKKSMMKNKSQLEVLPGTMNAVNGPHPQVVHVDEVELMDPEVYLESRNMSQGRDKNGRTYRAQDIITSTRKRGIGPMQMLIDQINEAKLQGMEVPYEMYSWCVFECAKPMNNCAVAYPDLPPEEQCDCSRVASGRWDSGAPRTLKDVCGGRFAKSDGWIDHDTIKNVFTKSSQGIWEAQQECIKPSTEGLVMPHFSVERHGIQKYDPDPDLGPIYMSIDFGGTNPHSVGWYQVLKYEIEIKDAQGKIKRLREGTRVRFDEIYKAEVSNTQICEMIVNRERFWRSIHPRFKVKHRFCDPQGKAARLDMARHTTPLPTIFITTRDVKEHVKICSYLVEQDLFVVDVGRCEMFVQEIESWHYPKKKPGMVDDPDIPVDDFDHTMSDWRYAMANIDKMDKVGYHQGSLPVAAGNIHQTVKGAGRRRNELPAWAPSNRGLPRSEHWRLKFGGIGE
jgi:hypothetical protein